MLRRQYFGHLMARADLLEKTLILGKIEGKRRGGGRGWDGSIASPTQWTWVWANSGTQWRVGKPGVLQSMRSQSQTQLSDWVTATIYKPKNAKVYWQALETRKRQEGILSWKLKRNHRATDSLIPYSGLQNCERINFCCFNVLHLWYFVIATL